MKSTNRTSSGPKGSIPHDVVREIRRVSQERRELMARLREIRAERARVLEALAAFPNLEDLAKRHCISRQMTVGIATRRAYKAVA